MGGDKIVLLDGAGANGGGAATNGLLSMIPGMFANLIGGNKMDPNLVAALMNGRNNQDGFGGANGWWLWIIVLFWLWGGRGFGNGFGNGGDCCANGLPAQLNNDYGRELLMQAIQGNRSAIDQIAPLVLLTRLILGDRYSEEVTAITDVDVTTDVAITTLLSDFIKRGG